MPSHPRVRNTNINELNSVAKAIVSKPKGVLAADESSPTIKKRFQFIQVESTDENRRRYRELLFTADGIERNIGRHRSVVQSRAATWIGRRRTESTEPSSGVAHIAFRLPPRSFLRQRRCDESVVEHCSFPICQCEEQQDVARWHHICCLCW
jgi:hypothetical protein